MITDASRCRFGLSEQLGRILAALRQQRRQALACVEHPSLHSANMIPVLLIMIPVLLIMIPVLLIEQPEGLMRGSDVRTGELFSYVDLEERVPRNHPLRQIRRVVNEVLAALDGEFETLYAAEGRPSIAPERLLLLLFERSSKPLAGRQSSICPTRSAGPER